MPESAPEQGVIKELDGHELKAIIAQSPRSTIYQARQNDKDKVVVLKALASEAAKQPEQVQAFLESAKAAAKVVHPGAVRLFRAGSDKGVPFVTMEFVEGPNLESVLQKKGKLPAPVVAQLLLQGLGVLEAAEKAGVQHGRLQPSHCLMAPGRNLKLVGYIWSGLPDDEEKRLPFYISPEEASGEGAGDHRRDLYSLGATFYHALCGTPPFVSDNPVQLRINITEQPLVSPIEEDPSLPRGLSEVIVKLLARNPAERYASATAALAALNAVMPEIASGGPTGLAEPPLPGDIAIPPDLSGAVSAPPFGAPAEDLGGPMLGGEAPGAATQSMRTHIPTVDLTPEPVPGAAAVPVPDQPAFVDDGEAATARALPAEVVVVKTGGLSAKMRTIWLSLLWTVIILSVCGGGAYFYFYKLTEWTGPGGPKLKEGGEQCVTALDEATIFEAQNEGDFIGAISAFQKVIDQCPGTVQAAESEKSIDRLKAEFNTAGELEWVDVSGKCLELMNEKKHQDCYRQLKEFQKKYLGAKANDEVVRFLEDLRDRNLSTITALYAKAEKLSPKEDRDEIELILLEMEKEAIPDILPKARELAQKYRDYYLDRLEAPEGEAVALAERLYDDYRREMQLPARMNDHESALREVEKFSAQIANQLKVAKSEKDRLAWESYQKWAEVDRKSLEIVRKRWDLAVSKWFEDNKGNRAKVGTTQGVIEDYREGRIFVRNGKDVFTEPSGMLAPEKMMPIAFPKREILIGEEVLEEGWWLLYQEDIAGAKKAEKSAAELRATSDDLKEAIARWVFSGWQLDPLFTAKGSSNPDGRVQLLYDFSDRGQATDWFAIEGEFQVVRKSMYPVGLGDHGSLIQSQFPMVGDVEMSMDVELKTQESIVRLGFMHPEGRHREYHYVELSPRRVGHWVGKHVEMTGGNANKPRVIQPLPVNEKINVKLEWQGATLTVFVDQRQIYVYKYPRTGVWMGVIGNKEDQVTIDNILILGKPDRKWIAGQQPALWLAQEKRRKEEWAPLFNGKNLEGWKQFGKGECKVAGQDTLEMDGLNPTLEIGQRDWRNYIFAAKVRIKTGATVRLFIRRNPGRDGTKDARQFVFSCGSYVDCGVYDGKEYDWFKSNDFIGAWHTHWHDLTISAKGDFFNVFIDGRLYYQIETSKRRAGTVAIYSHGTSQWKDVSIKLLR